MSTRIHTANVGNVGTQYTYRPESFCEDEEMAVGPALVIEDGGNDESFVIVGSVNQIAHFARRILKQLPVQLTEPKLSYLNSVCEDHGYDVDAGSVGRSNNGWAYFTADEDGMSYDLTNEQEREVTYDD